MRKTLRYRKKYSRILHKNWGQTQEPYSQHSEDIFIERTLGCDLRSFIDTEANDRGLFSNTYKFAKTGARDLCLEPCPSTFFIHGSNAFGPRAPIAPVQYPTITVPTLTFEQNKLRRYSRFTQTNLLAVDVEDHERQVFVVLYNCPVKVRVIVLEADKTNIDSHSLPFQLS